MPLLLLHLLRVLKQGPRPAPDLEVDHRMPRQELKIEVRTVYGICTLPVCLSMGPKRMNVSWGLAA